MQLCLVITAPLHSCIVRLAHRRCLPQVFRAREGRSGRLVLLLLLLLASRLTQLPVPLALARLGLASLKHDPFKVFPLYPAVAGCKQVV